jgi:hypothetical protein
MERRPSDFAGQTVGLREMTMSTTSSAPRFYPTRLSTELHPHVHGERHRGHRRLVEAIRFAEQDNAVVRRALAAHERLSVLLAHAPLSDVAAAHATRWLDEIESALLRLLPPR